MTDSDLNDLVITDRGAVRILTINREDRANSITPDMSRRLGEIFVEAESDDAVRVIVLTGAGQKIFCAGMDLKARARNDGAGRRMLAPTRGLRRMTYEVIQETWKPTIAAINGAAVGGGLELALACDMRVASSEAILALPEAKRGLGAHFGTVMLSRVVPQAIAYEMMFSGEPLTAQRAYEVGLVNRLAAPDKVLEAALVLADSIAANAPVTVRRMKETTVRASGLPLSAAMRLNEGLSPYESEDRKEGVRAFLERRPPNWTGR
jgi:enoyl-CoA hydratase